MKITLTSILPRRSRSKSEPTDRLLADYIDRIGHYAPCDSQLFETEVALLDWLDRSPGRIPAYSVLLDSRGRQLSSTEFASWLGSRRDQGTQHIVFAIGPADGWSSVATEAAKSGLLLSFGPITMAHELARLVLAEQLYRACTILAGHPYHSGH